MKGLKLGVHGTPFSHLIFVVDVLIFGKASSKKARSIHFCLLKFMSWSGQSTKSAKSFLLFSPNTSGDNIRTIKDIFSSHTFSFRSKHLGLPMFLDHKKSNSFKHITHRINQEIATWKLKLLTQAARSQLIVSVAASIHTYSMSVFQMSQGFCKEIDRSLKNLWWGVSLVTNLIT